MSTNPEIRCDAWQDGESIPIEYTAPKDSNIQTAGVRQPENRIPNFSFANTPQNTRVIALVVHDILEGEPVNGVRPGWTHYTALYSPQGKLIALGLTDENESGWVGPYPVVSGEYHCTAYFLNCEFTQTDCNRTSILETFKTHGLGKANLVGKYTNPRSKN